MLTEEDTYKRGDIRTHLRVKAQMVTQGQGNIQIQGKYSNTETGTIERTHTCNTADITEGKNKDGDSKMGMHTETRKTH